MGGQTTSPGDARSAILQSAIHLFARHGFDGVTVRGIATGAGVSPALVLHHFTSKLGLQDAVIDAVQHWFDQMLVMAESARAKELAERGAMLAEISLAFHSVPDLPELLLRLVVDRDPRMTELLGQFLDHTQAVIAQYVDEGAMVDDPDPRMRAAILLAGDFGTMLLRRHLVAILGVDPFVGEGLARHATTATRVYGALLPEGSWLTDPVLGVDLAASTDEPGDGNDRDHH